MTRDVYLTFAVRNLPPGTTAKDVHDHITRKHRSARPVVGSLIWEPNRRALQTIVTIRRSADWKCKVVREEIKHRIFRPGRPETDVRESNIDVDDEFLGVTTVAEHENAQFDMYFIHGLGGHAFTTWCNDTAVPQMWPKDFFPDNVEAKPRDPNDPTGARLAGRFSIVGYHANALTSWSATMTIEKAAQELLTHLSVDRPEGCKRPMFFACHSLGGLVTCQALIHALHEDSKRPGQQEGYKKVFFQDGECLVKGIFFFGTPFAGSRLALVSSVLVKVFGGNGELIDSLKHKSDQLGDIVGKFNQILSHPETKIPILLSYEKHPMRGVGFVTDHNSAVSSFDAETIGIDGDHRSMVKFATAHEMSYRLVAEKMIRYIQRSLSSSGYAASTRPEKASLVDEAPEKRSFPIAVPRRTDATDSGKSLPPYPSPPPSISPPPYESSWSFTGDIKGSPKTLDSPTWPLPFRPEPEAEVVGIMPKPESPVQPAAAPIKFSDLVQTQENGKEDHNKLTRLRMFDTVFILDDTGSMAETYDEAGARSRWSDLIESLRYTVDIVCRYDKDGVDVHFLCSDDMDKSGITNGQEVMDLLNEVEPDEIGGGTYISQQLWGILSSYLDRFEEWKVWMKERPRSKGPKVEKPKMLNLIIVTDGAADDKEDVENVIVEAAKRLDKLGALPYQVGIQFLQIGKDEDAAQWLNKLDDSLKAKHDVRDIVDTRPWDHPKEIDKPLQERLVQILLGAIDRSQDGNDTVEV
ncbi:hypothetical protein B0T25DRAFT_526318 [Lasiosphaeria hispida]|uniref:VWFA domain-containing protein n=1 Tax=Lasiosphaeria hispida TaxID=260671 RepID=A0AAJ0MK20_9PEZI|nr:hypothetical protein B0T25DRAFT_526318 [Lasiosphaeria hispida]